MARVRRMDDEAVRERLGTLQGWTLEEGKLHRDFRFDDFAGAFAFMAALALFAEARDHHPEWSNVYNRVTIDLTTHDVDGISELDFAFAERADALAG